MTAIPLLPPTGEPAEYNSNYILYWNNVALELNRLTVTVSGPYSGPPSAARALGMLHLAIHDAYFAIKPSSTDTYLDPEAADPELRLPRPLGARDRRQAVAGAANTVLQSLYATRSAGVANASTDILAAFLQQSVNAFPGLDTLSSSYRFGVAVGNAILNHLGIKPGEPGFDQDSFRPGPGPNSVQPGMYRFGDDPTNPVRIVPVDINNPDGPKKSIRVYQAPFYGLTAKRLAVQHKVDGNPTEHIIADPPVGFGVNDIKTYNIAVDEVYRQGGAATLPTTRRQPHQTESGFFWAYDGANLIGTPPRHYNQILRKLAWTMRPDQMNHPTKEDNNADFARVFALVNAALADAGIFAWQEKYCFEFWRPLSGIRQAPPGSLDRDPFWLTLGAPDTNLNEIPFKPPFPSYPSGHATFGGAAFQAMRLFYKTRNATSQNVPNFADFAADKPDKIAFEWMSDELNGISRDLRDPYDRSKPITDQKGTVRTAVTKQFPSLWDAMFDNAISRVYLGVHWGFDAFAASDVLNSVNVKSDGTNDYKATDQIMYTATGPRGDRPGQLFPVGGVPLGIGIANDIFQNGLKPTPANKQPSGRNKCGDPNVASRTKADEEGPALVVQNGDKTPAVANGDSA